MKKFTAFMHRIIVGENYLQLQKDLKENERQTLRVSAAYDLHRYVLRNYGWDAYSLLQDPEIIIQDTKEITVFNYLDTESIVIH